MGREQESGMDAHRVKPEYSGLGLHPAAYPSPHSPAICPSH
jgi:hypothetical protein